MRQRWFALTMLIAVLGLIAACDSDDDDDAANGEAGTTPTMELETVAPDEGTESAGDAEGTAALGEDAETPTIGDDGTVAEQGDEGTATDDVEGTAVETPDATQSTDGETTTPSESETTPTEADVAPTAEDESESTPTESEGTTAETATESQDGEMARLGEPVDVSGLTVTVDEVVDVSLAGPLDGELIEPEEGNEFVGVRLTIENTDAEPVGLMQVLGRIYLEDADGEQHRVDLGATALALLSENFDALSDLESDEEVQLVVGFQVPEDSEVSEMTFVLEGRDTMTDVVRVQLEES